MELISRLSAFEKFKLDAEFRDDCTLQCVKTSFSGPRTWQVWKRARLLGGGRFGKVWQESLEGPNGDWLYRAVKVCPQEEMKSAGVDYKRELSALAAFSASKYAGFFVSFHGWWMDSKNVFVAMEYMGRGDLATYVPAGLEESEAKEVAENLLNGLLAMHQEGFTHRDIKPQNILVVQKRPEYQRWWVKIADFGISKRILEDSGTSLHTSIGTRPYCAPEVLGYLQQYEQTSVYSSKVDMWSLGCVLFNIGARGHLAFSESDLVRYVDGRLPFNHTAREIHFGTDGVSLIKWLLQPDPERRLSALEALRHPWLSSEGQHLFLSMPSADTSLKRRSISPPKPPLADHWNYNSFLQSTLSSQFSNPISFNPESRKPPPMTPYMNIGSLRESERAISQDPQISQSESIEVDTQRPANRLHVVPPPVTRKEERDHDKEPEELANEIGTASQWSPAKQQGSNDRHPSGTFTSSLIPRSKIQEVPAPERQTSSYEATFISSLNLVPRNFFTGFQTEHVEVPRSREDIKEIYYFNDKLVLDIPMPPKFLAKIPHAEAPERDEFTHVRYSDLDDFPAGSFPFRPWLFAKPRAIEILIRLTIGSQTSAVVAAEVGAILSSVRHMERNFGEHYWKKIVVSIVGNYTSLHPSVYALLSALGVYYRPYKKLYQRQEAGPRIRKANVYEYTSQKGVNVSSGIVEIIPRSSPCQLMFSEIMGSEIMGSVLGSGVEEHHNSIASVLQPRLEIKRHVDDVGYGLRPITETYIYERWVRNKRSHIAREQPAPSAEVSHGKTFWIYPYEAEERDAEYLENISKLNWTEGESRNGGRLGKFFRKFI